ncbi:MAG: S-layer homology domain-containing protein [bacterium]|nr:S-layer homology domain-containing protein [bacterium]
MKKTLSIILTAAMTAMAFTAPVSAFTDTTELNDTQITILNNAVEKGIIKGYEDDTVRPYNTLTRAEFTAMLCRAFGYTTGNGCSFNDAAAHWASAYIQACVDKGAINGIGNNLFDPEAPVTFYQASKIITIVSSMTNGFDIDNMGGYPLAYLTIGQNSGLYTNTTAGFTGEDYNLCRIDAVTMINNIAPNDTNTTLLSFPSNSKENLKAAIENSVVKYSNPENTYERIEKAIDGYIKYDMRIVNEDCIEFLTSAMENIVGIYISGKMNDYGGSELFILNVLSESFKLNPEFADKFGGLIGDWERDCIKCLDTLAQLVI